MNGCLFFPGCDVAQLQRGWFTQHGKCISGSKHIMLTGWVVLSGLQPSVLEWNTTQFGFANIVRVSFFFYLHCPYNGWRGGETLQTATIAGLEPKIIWQKSAIHKQHYINWQFSEKKNVVAWHASTFYYLFAWYFKHNYWGSVDISHTRGRHK